MNDQDLRWEEISREILLQDEWIEFRRSAYRYPDGRVFSPYYSYSRRDYAVIVASDPEGNYLCVRQFRQGIREVTTEFPAGGIERKDEQQHGDPSDADNALAAARRELMEETGYASDEWTHLMTLPANATISDNYAHIYRARNCRRVGAQHLDETEYLHVSRLKPEEIDDLIRTGRFQQAMHVLAWMLAGK